MAWKRFSWWWATMVVIEATEISSSESQFPSASVRPPTASPDTTSDIQRLAYVVIPRCLSNNSQTGNSSYFNRSNSSVRETFVPPIVALTDDNNQTFNITIEEVNLNCGIWHHVSTRIIGNDSADTATALIKIINNTARLFMFHEDPCYKLMTDEFCFHVERTLTNSTKNDKSEIEYIANFCLNKSIRNYICSNATLLRKCCAKKHLLLENICEVDERSPEGQWRPRLVSSDLENPKVLYGIPSCEDKFDMDGDDVSFLDNGSIYIETIDFSTREYCIEDMEEANGTLNEIVVICGDPEELWSECTLVINLKRYLTIVSCLSLVVTLCLYAFHPKIRRQQLHAWSLMSMISAQLVALITFEVIRSTSITSPAGCMCLAEICLVSVLAMFFWYNIISFDMAVKSWDGPELRDSRRWFVMYSVYAWGCPLVVGAVVLLMDALAPPHAILPDVHPPNCWLRTNASQWAYMKGIVVAVMLVNLYMYVHLLYRLVQLRRGSIRVKGSYRHLWHRCRLPLSLGVMMGVCWMGELFSSNSNQCGRLAKVQTMVSGLQGVFILLLVLSNANNRQVILDERSTIRVLIRSVRRLQPHRNSSLRANQQPGNTINDTPSDADQSCRVVTSTQNIALTTSPDIQV